MPAQVTSSSLDHSSKLRGPSPKAPALGSEDLQAPLAPVDRNLQPENMDKSSLSGNFRAPGRKLQAPNQ
ncbi:hypothetical protein TNCV_18651 [Trichonephila clavipes]|nr:hypothetical protein TNCV_18651 [Trichonephila clavipes]